MGQFGVILCKRGRPMDRVAGFYIKCCQQIAIICQAFNRRSFFEALLQECRKVMCLLEFIGAID